MAVAEEGTVYVTRREPGDVLALRDEDGDGRADKIATVVSDMPGVHGIALRDDTLYLATVREVYAVPLQGTEVGEPRRVLSGLPPGGRHPNRTLGFGPDGLLYISVGSTCNACMEESPESAAILQAKADGSKRAVFASGLRNTIGFGWHPQTQQMWGMDHGTDWLGDDFPPEELNRLQSGQDYGWPFIYGDGQIIELTDYPISMDKLKQLAARATLAVLKYTAHSAPIQLAFYTATQFPEPYRNDAFVAMHGSWNRKPPSGYEVVRIDFEDGRPRAIEPFVTGFLVEGPAYFARPAGIAVAADGALLIGDDANGAIYRVSYGGDG
jgi:glucose/arabinose dehydrogenase